MSEQPSDPAAGVFPEVQGLRLLHELGRSPKGITYKARRLVEQDVVAAKILRRSRCEKRFLSELPRKAESTFVLEHKGLVRSLGCVEGMERLVLLMDYAPGDALAKLLRPGEPLLLSRALLSALQCVNALRYASLHQLYHGRLHPADVLLGEDHVRITGVGLGQRPEHAAWAEAEAPPFEPLIYTAPEAMPSKPFPESPVAQAAVDIYSLGAILFHTLTGAPPFRSVDEGALVNERKLLATAVVWPGQRKAVLPAELIALVEEMLAGEAQARPRYDELAGKLSEALSGAEKAEMAIQTRVPRIAGAAPAVHTETPPMLKVPPAIASAPHQAAGAPPGRAAAAPGARAAAAVAPRVPAVPATAAASPWGYALPRPAKPSLGARIYNTLLMGLTALVFIIAVVLAAKIFIWDGINKQQQAPLAANQPPAKSTAATPPAVQPQPAEALGQQPRLPVPQPPAANAHLPRPPAPAPGPVTEPEHKGDEYAAATRQLEVIQDLLAKKEVRPGAGLLKIMNEIAAKSGRETPTGIKALVQAREIEETLARPGQPAGAGIGTAAAETPPVIPGVGRAGAPQAEKPPAAPETPPQPPAAPAKTAETPATPPTTPPAKTAETPPAPTPPAKPAVAEAAGTGKLTVTLRGLMAKARACQYTELSADLTKLSSTLEGEEKTAVETYAGLAKRQQELFKRCRKWLVDEIQRRTKHDSPLQVFPRKNEPGDDIVDFDEQGLKISEKRPTGTSQRTLPWDKTPAAQAFALLQLTSSDKNSVEDHLGLAAFAFSCGLKAETEAELTAARALPGGREKTEALEEQIKKLGKALE